MTFTKCYNIQLKKVNLWKTQVQYYFILISWNLKLYFPQDRSCNLQVSNIGSIDPRIKFLSIMKPFHKVLFMISLSFVLWYFLSLPEITHFLSHPLFGVLIDKKVPLISFFFNQNPVICRQINHHVKFSEKRPPFIVFAGKWDSLDGLIELYHK